MRLLLIEDDDRMAGFALRGLREAGYAVTRAADGQAGLDLALGDALFDVAVVDVMLPRLDGLALVARLRERGSALPVLLLSARRDVDSRVAGLRAGGDDYLTKPFAFAELLARLEALLRRSGPHRAAAEPTRLAAGPVALDLLTRAVTRAGETVELQPREFELLALLLRHAGRVVSKTMILEAVWGYRFDPRTNAVDVLVHRLRKKIDEPFEPRLVETVRGVGYRLRVP